MKYPDLTQRIMVEDLMNNPKILDSVLRNILKADYSKSTKKIMYYIEEVMDMDTIGYERPLVMTIVNHLKSMMANGHVIKDYSGYRLSSKAEEYTNLDEEVNE
jgi:hypothetical protein